MTNLPDIRAALLDLRARYEASGWVDPGIAEGFDNLADALEQCENGETSPVQVVRRIVTGLIWFDPHEEGPKRTMDAERDAVERLMRLIKRGKGD